MMQSIPIRNNLTAIHEGKDSFLSKLISAKTKTDGSDAAPVELAQPNEYAALWNAAWWGFDESAAFGRLSADAQTRVLANCNRGLINEAYFIEKSGLAYCAKMVLLAESTDVAQLYSLIGADEAKHLAWIEPFVVPEDKTQPAGYFLEFLTRLIEQLPPRLLVLLVQIVLEGWGLDHYKRLSEGCSNPALAAVFRDILKDEALHHKSGNMLFDAAKLSEADRGIVKEGFLTYAQMVQVGPTAALDALTAETGALSTADLQDNLKALRHPQEAQRKLSLLTGLMRQPGLEDLVDELLGRHL